MSGREAWWVSRRRRAYACAVDLGLVIAGALFLLWPVLYRRSMAKIDARLRERGGDRERFRRGMDRGWIRAALVGAPAVGAGLLVLGLLSG